MPHVALAGEPVRQGVPNGLRARRLRIGLASDPSIKRRQLLRLNPHLDLNTRLLRARLHWLFHGTTC